MARARFIAKASGSNFFSVRVSVSTSLMTGTLQADFRVVSRSMPVSSFIVAPGVLHRDKVPWFCHIGAPPVGFLVHLLIVSGDKGLSAAAATGEISLRWL